MQSAFEKFYAVVSKVPKGKVITYQDVALAAGIPGGARAVGNAMACNQDTQRVPCHRVVQSTGFPGGYMGDRKKSNLKIRRLLAEGIQIKPENGKIKNFEKVRLQPSKLHHPEKCNRSFYSNCIFWITKTNHSTS